MWNIFGIAGECPLLGSRLDPLVHLDTFWFAWIAYRPDSEIVKEKP